MTTIGIYDKLIKRVKRRRFASHLGRWRSAGFTHMYFTVSFGMDIIYSEQVRRIGDSVRRFYIILEVSVINKNELMVNEEIKDNEVRLIDEDGSIVGILSSKDAIQIAYQKNLDLVMIAPTAKPPVCKIMDYNKYMFDMAKKDRENRKNQKIVNIKEVRLGLGIGEHDFQVKVRGAVKFLQDGDKVKVTVRFGGREMNHTGDGEILIDRFAEAVKEYGTMEKRPKLEGRRMTVIINAK